MSLLAKIDGIPGKFGMSSSTITTYAALQVAFVECDLMAHYAKDTGRWAKAP
jgi:hypothetical protein